MADSVSVSTTINAPPARVWTALTDPKIIKTYFFGADVKTDWKKGSKITWSGEHDGHRYEDKGEIKEVREERRLSMTHWSPMSGLPDAPANYHTVSYDLEGDGGRTRVTLTQDNLNGMKPEQAKQNWETVLDGLKQAVTH